MNSRLLLGLCAIAALTSTSNAQSQEPTDENTLEAPRFERELDRWRDEHGSSWRASVDPQTGYAEFLYGGSSAAPFEPTEDGDFFDLARQALADSAVLHGIEPTTLVEDRTLFLPLGQIGSSDKMTVRYKQQLNGVFVESGFANVLFDLQGRMLAVQTTALPSLAGLDTSPALDADRALRRALELFAGDNGLAANFWNAPELWIIRHEDGEDYRPALAWKIGAQWEQNGFETLATIYYIDAANGDVLRRAPGIHHLDVSGTVRTMSTPGLAPDTGSNPETQNTVGRVTLNSDQGSVQTDDAGNFNFSGVNQVTNVQVAYVGAYANVENLNGPELVENLGTLTGSGNNVLMNFGAGEETTAQANAFVAVHHMVDWIHSINPADTTMDFVAEVDVNISDTCNAGFSPINLDINFFLKEPITDGCPNTAYSTIVGHEHGHWANVVYGTNNGSDGMGEGNADVWAMYQFDTNIVAQDFFGPGLDLRDGTNTLPFCGDCCPNCHGGSVHTNGQVWMGAAWKVRTNLKNDEINPAFGSFVADSLFLGWMNGFDQTQIKTAIEDQWLTLDDDNGFLDDGTPHFSSIDDGFRSQSFPGVNLPLVSVTHTPLTDTTDQVGPYAINANIQALILPPLLTAELRYRVGGFGAFLNLPMTSTGGDGYTASIPGQVGPALIQYYISGSDSVGNIGTGPDNAPTEVFQFFVGEINTIFTDNFTSDQGWTVADTDLASGSWERINPEGTSAQPEDDNPAGIGTLCFVTDGDAGTSTGSFDVDGGPTDLFSPVIDTGGLDGRVRYAYWSFNDDGDDTLEVAISDDGFTWVTAKSYLGAQGGWSEDSFVISNFVNPGQIQLRFRTSDNPNDSFTEAAVDDVEIDTVASLCAAPSNFCTPTANSTGSPAILAAHGTTSVAANNLSLISSPVPVDTSIFIYSLDPAAETPIGNGNLCIGATQLGFFVRGPGLLADPLGFTQWNVDLTNPPVPEGQITAGTTWYFQHWYRDNVAGPGQVNWSDGIEIEFCP